MFETLAKFKLYNIENFNFVDNTVKFEYISIIKDIICKCEYTNNYIRIIITGDEWKRTLQKDEMLLNLSDIDKIREYLKYNINELDTIEYTINIYEISVGKLESIIKSVDKLLLNIFLLIDNENIIDTADLYVTCLYPGYYPYDNNLYNKLLINTPIIERRYEKYLGYSHIDLVDNMHIMRSAEFGFIENEEYEEYEEYTFITCVSNADYDYLKRLGKLTSINNCNVNYDLILNKNFITAIRYLGQLHLCEDVRIKLCKNELIVYNPNNRILHLNNIRLTDRKIIIGRIIGDRLLLNYSKEIGFKYNPILLIE